MEYQLGYYIYYVEDSELLCSNDEAEPDVVSAECAHAMMSGSILICVFVRGINRLPISPLTEGRSAARCQFADQSAVVPRWLLPHTASTRRVPVLGPRSVPHPAMPRASAVLLLGVVLLCLAATARGGERSALLQMLPELVPAAPVCSRPLPQPSETGGAFLKHVCHSRQRLDRLLREEDLLEPRLSGLSGLSGLSDLSGLSGMSELSDLSGLSGMSELSELPEELSEALGLSSGAHPPPAAAVAADAAVRPRTFSLEGEGPDQVLPDREGLEDEPLPEWAYDVAAWLAPMQKSVSNELCRQQSRAYLEELNNAQLWALKSE